VAQPPPEFLLPLRERVAELTQCSPEDLAEVLVSEYVAGAGIGWHRDAPPFDFLVGISLRGECTMKFRPWPGGRTAKPAKPLSLLLEPRSVYVIRGPARTHWQHHIPTDKAPQVFHHLPDIAVHLGLGAPEKMLLPEWSGSCGCRGLFASADS
jgi:alkylated DNA repair dioxygenase AlkB